MAPLLLLFVMGQSPPATPSTAYPATEGGIRDRYQRISLSAAPPDVTRAVFELRRRDGGTFDCAAPASCQVRTSAPFDEIVTDTLPDDYWCFRGRYENDAGTSAFSNERCYLDDKTPPPQPTFVDAGLVNGIAVIDYVGVEDVGPAPSLVGTFCARASEEVNGDNYGPYCTAGPWGRGRTPDAGAFFSYTLRLPLPPGTWKVGVMANDRASFGSPVHYGPTFVIAEVGSPPPPPYWRDVDGGVGPDDSWTRDQYLTRAVYPAVPGHQGAIIQKRDENGAWETVSTVLGLNGGTSVYVRTGVVRKQVRYAVVHSDGGASPWSSPLNVRLDTVPPAALDNCNVAIAPTARTISVNFTGGVDALSTSSFSAKLMNADGGTATFPLGTGGGSFDATDDVWLLTVIARDEAGNATTLVCGSVEVPGPVPDAGVPDAGLADAGSDDAGIEDAGVEEPDAGSEPPDAGVPLEPRELGVGCACGDSGAVTPWVLFLMLALTNRVRRGRAPSR